MQASTREGKEAKEAGKDLAKDLPAPAKAKTLKKGKGAKIATISKDDIVNEYPHSDSNTGKRKEPPKITRLKKWSEFFDFEELESGVEHMQKPVDQLTELTEEDGSDSEPSVDNYDGQELGEFLGAALDLQEGETNPFAETEPQSAPKSERTTSSDGLEEMVADGDSGPDSGEEEKSERPPEEDGFFSEANRTNGTPPPFRPGEFDFPFEAPAARAESKPPSTQQPAHQPGSCRGREGACQVCDAANARALPRENQSNRLGFLPGPLLEVAAMERPRANVASQDLTHQLVNQLILQSNAKLIAPCAGPPSGIGKTNVLQQ